ncbi:hypothetical protein DWB84_12725 [Saccharophagus sp. K07]|nr:hypothetical protein [Saccharophagus sp. K07]
MDRKHKSLKIRALNSLCSFALIGALIYVLIAGFEALAVAVITISLIGMATPVVASGGSILETLVGVLEAIVGGVVSVVEGIASAISALFN